MPTVATQTYISTVSSEGFNKWCNNNMDTVDRIPSINTSNMRKNLLKKNNIK